mgnify:CR=1 FL=1
MDLSAGAADVHNGYFSIDKKKIGGKTVEMVKDTSGSTAADDDTYNLIMRDKEKLLSFDSPLKFIFSHSALKEGWDNPNVFQICALREMGTERERRQTIGRGLRLCVNQKGERLRGFEINTLTVVATDSRRLSAVPLECSTIEGKPPSPILPIKAARVLRSAIAAARWCRCRCSTAPCSTPS